MNIKEQINTYLQSLPAQKQNDMQALHNLMLQIMPTCKLWFLDGKDDSGKTVSNPSIGYGFQHLKYADGKTREFYQLGISANTTGITVYIMGIEDKKYLHQTYGKKLGKATVTSYCIKLKALKDINLNVLEDAIRFGFTHQ